MTNREKTPAAEALLHPNSWMRATKNTENDCQAV